MLKQQPKVMEVPNPKMFEYKGGELEFRNVGFKHPAELAKEGQTQNADEYLFQNLNLKI